MGTFANTDLLPEELDLEHLSVDGEGLTVRLRSASRSARCPACGRVSRRVHSRYERKLSDLPRHGARVILRVKTRRFFCDGVSCERRIFCERLPEVAAHARKTGRLEEALLAIALRLGGRASARLAAQLGLLASRDALLERAKGAPPADLGGKVRVLGVDDFAFRKGHAYGTILVDLERRKVVDLLPGRSAESLARWIEGHPGVEVAARDRSFVYANGISAGAPGAVQVADRWHLLRGLALALENFMLQKRPALREAASPEAPPRGLAPPEAAGEDVAAAGPMSPNRPRLWYARQEEAAGQRHERLVEQWREIRRLHLAGMDLREIHRTLGVSVRTVYRYKDLAEPPPRPAYKRRASVLDPYVPYLVRRWNEGCHNGRRLYREIREQGYSHAVPTSSGCSRSSGAPRPEAQRSPRCRAPGRGQWPARSPRPRTSRRF